MTGTEQPPSYAYGKHYYYGAQQRSKQQLVATLRGVGGVIVIRARRTGRSTELEICWLGIATPRKVRGAHADTSDQPSCGTALAIVADETVYRRDK